MAGVIARIVHNQSFIALLLSVYLLKLRIRTFVKTLVKYEIVFYIDTGIIISQQVPVTFIINFFIMQFVSYFGKSCIREAECTHASKACKLVANCETAC